LLNKSRDISPISLQHALENIRETATEADEYTWLQRSRNLQ